MAYDWVENEVAVNHKGVTVYHVYPDDLMQSGTRKNWFTMDPDGRECEDDFDVRSLRSALSGEVADDSPEGILVQAIEEGILVDGMSLEDIEALYIGQSKPKQG